MQLRNLLQPRSLTHIISRRDWIIPVQSFFRQVAQDILRFEDEKSHETRYPPSLVNALLADSFADFFTAKVEKIHTALVARNRDLSLADDNELLTNAAELNNFHEVSQEDVKQFVYKPLVKSCCLDPLPASLLKDCFPLLLPTITGMVNLSLTTGFMRDALKIASLSPTLKKPTANFKQFVNFRLILNLKFISKLVEKSVAVQLTNML